MTAAPQSIQPRIGSLSAEDREELDAVFIAYLRNQRNEQAARIAELITLLASTIRGLRDRLQQEDGFVWLDDIQALGAALAQPTQGGGKGGPVAFVPLTEDGRPQWAETFGADDGCYIDYPEKWRPLYYAAPQPASNAGGDVEGARISNWLADYSHDLMEDGDLDQEAAEIERAAQWISCHLNTPAYTAQEPLSKEERHAVEHARYQVGQASIINPDCAFDYDLVKDLIRAIDRAYPLPSTDREGK